MQSKPTTATICMTIFPISCAAPVAHVSITDFPTEFDRCHHIDPAPMVKLSMADYLAAQVTLTA
jgi:hypothetical protein